MSWIIQVVPQILTPLASFAVAIGAVVWGRQRIDALKEQLASKDVAMAAKDEQIKAQREAMGSKNVAMAAKDEQMNVLQLRLQNLERTSPREMLKEVEALKDWTDRVVSEARSKADLQIAEVTKASREEREQLLRELDRNKTKSDEAAKMVGDLLEQAKTSQAEREHLDLLESELQTARQVVGELEEHIANTETAEQYFQSQADDQAQAEWDERER